MPSSFDPQEHPPVSVDRHLPAVTSTELQADSLRQRFLAPPSWTPEAILENQASDRLLTHASVLIPLVQRDQLTVLLTQRTAHLSDHPGQISFPGGRAEPEDVNEVATALREAHEEIGLAPRFVDVLGQLPPYATGTGFIVTPVVALVRPGFSIQVDPFEVAEAFEVPLAFLMDPSNHRWHSAEIAGGRRQFLSMPWNGIGVDGHPRHYFVWGATAAMLRNLYRFLIA